jgi:hypothetical protein
VQQIYAICGSKSCTKSCVGSCISTPDSDEHVIAQLNVQSSSQSAAKDTSAFDDCLGFNFGADVRQRGRQEGG